MSKLNNWFTKFNSENTIISFVKTDKDCMKNGYYGSSSYERSYGYSDGCGYGAGSGDGDGFCLKNGKGSAYREYNGD